MSERFKLWRSTDIDDHTDEWAVLNSMNGEYIDEQEVVDLLNNQQDTIKKLNMKCEYELRMLEELYIKFEYESRMHQKWKDEYLAILEEQELEKYVEELQNDTRRNER